MIKSIASVAFLFLTTSLLIAQDCSTSFYAMKEGTKLSVSHYNDKGKITSVSESTIKAVKSTPTGFAATVTAKFNNEKGKVLVDNKDFDVQCDNGTIKLDVSTMFMADFAQQAKSMEMQISGKSLEIPSNLSEGMSLPDGNTEIKMGTGGMTLMTVNFDIKNRKVEKKESITVPAGTFECYKITYDMDMKMMMRRSMKVSQWMAVGVGLVKSENYNAKGEREGYSELTKFEKP
jgi:hypothetical protein